MNIDYQYKLNKKINEIIEYYETKYLGRYMTFKLFREMYNDMKQLDLILEENTSDETKYKNLDRLFNTLIIFKYELKNEENNE
jgi:hypothetical protein